MTTTIPKPSTPVGELQLTGAQAQAFRRTKRKTQAALSTELAITQGHVAHLEASPKLNPGSICLLAAGYQLAPVDFVRAAIKASESIATLEASEAAEVATSKRKPKKNGATP